LVRLGVTYDTMLTDLQKYQISQLLPEEFTSFHELTDLFNKAIANIVPPPQEAPAPASWHGRRLGIELPLPPRGHAYIKKDLEPELLNHSFLWLEDYHHYDDWKHQMGSCYDNFNMLIIPHKKSEYKMFFD